MEKPVGIARRIRLDRGKIVLERRVYPSQQPIRTVSVDAGLGLPSSRSPMLVASTKPPK